MKAKASQAKHLLHFAVDLARELQESNGEIGESRFKSLECLQQIYDLAHRRELTIQDLTRWRALAAQHNYYYAACGFHAYPKFHYFLHIPAQAERGGVPRSFWVFAEETRNRHLKNLYTMCSKGYSICRQILERLQWEQALLHLM